MSSGATDRLRSAWAKIQRAKEHIVNLDAAIQAFRKTKPYEVRPEHDPQSEKLIYSMAKVEPVPDSVPLIAMDALQALRSALDHLAFQLFLTGTPQASGDAGRHVYFPICDSAAKYVAESPRKVQGMRQDAIDALATIEPYQGGKGHQFWVLHKLNNIDKHRLLITVGAAFWSVNIGAHATAGKLAKDLAAMMSKMTGEEVVFPVIDFHVGSSNRMCPLKVGDQLFIDAPNAEVNEKMDFRFEVAIHEPGIVEGEALLPFVHQLAQLVDNIVGTLAPLV